MKAGSKFTAASPGFTLVEVMVSLVVLGLLIAALAQVLNIATSTTINGRKHMDADSQARLVFDRIADDFSKMVKRPDVDYIFYKNTASATTGANDAMFFYSESPASVFVNATTVNSNYTATSQSTVSLVGYRINSNTYQLERLAEVLTWGTTTSNDATSTTGNTMPGSMTFLAYGTGSVTPAATSELDGNWSKTIGTVSNGYTDGTDLNYRALGEATFRLELSFLLTDGTLSTMPVLGSAHSVTPSTWPTVAPPGATVVPTFAHSGTADPDSSLTGNITAGSYYAVGSRWFNTTNRRGYICTSATPASTVWAPIGTQDISAIIVGLGILDNNSRKLVSKTMFGNMVGSLPDAANGVPVAQTWGASSYLTAAGAPNPAAQQIRLYQRYFYLNNQ